MLNVSNNNNSNFNINIFQLKLERFEKTFYKKKDSNILYIYYYSN